MRTRGVFILMLVVALSLVGCSHYYERTDEAPPVVPIPYTEAQVPRYKLRCATPREWYSRTRNNVFGRTEEGLVCGTRAGINLFDFGSWWFYRPFGDLHEIKPIPFFQRNIRYTSILCESPAGWYRQEYAGIGGSINQYLVCTTPATDEIRPIGLWGLPIGFGGAPIMPMMGGFGGTQYWPR